MILKKPYAFLIKYFKIIHIVLFALFAYVAFFSKSIVNFFKDYIKFTGNIEVISSKYLTPLVIISILLTIILTSIIFLLMRYKKKPRILYIIIGLVSIVSMILILYLHSNIKMLETSVLAAKDIRLLRDISNINYYMVLIASLPILVRGLGFDIKKFDFKKDLVELNVKEEDSEEIEVEIDFKNEKIERKGRKIIRELGYYYQEYKLFINIIIGVIILFLVIKFPFNKYIINGTLSENQIMNTSNYSIEVIDSYISERNKTSRDNSYVVLKVKIKGNQKKYMLNLDSIVLEGKNNNYIPSLKYYNYFNDIGIGYRNTTLNTNDYEEYLLIYNIKNEDKESKLKIHCLDNNRRIKLSPEIID